jgi:integrase
MTITARSFGKPLAGPARGVTAALAYQVRIDTLNKLNLGEFPAKMLNKKKFAIGQAIEAFFAWAESEGKNLRVDKSRYQAHIQPVYGNTPIEYLTPEIIDRFKTSLSQKMAMASVRHVFILMQKSINFAIRRKLWPGVNPISTLGGFSMPKADNKGERFLTPEEARTLLDELARRSPQWHDIALLSLHSGLRLTEIFKLRNCDIDENTKTAIVTAKSGQREPILLTDEALAAIMNHRGSPDELVFKTPGGQQFHNVSSVFTAAVNACGFNNNISDPRYKVWFHTLRHTFASWLAQSGVDIYALMRLMRHKTIEMTQRYAHLIPDRQRENLAVIQRNLQAAAQSSPLSHHQ